jgi:hypothetical protein
MVFVPTNFMCCRVGESVGEDVGGVSEGDTCHPYIHLRLWRMCRLKLKKRATYMFKTPFQSISLDAKI